MKQIFLKFLRLIIVLRWKIVPITNPKNKLQTYISKLFNKKTKPLKTVYKSSKQNKNSGTKDNDQVKIDAILDKISKSGYDTLTQKEKEFLFKQGK